MGFTMKITQTTQRANTVGSYEKAANLIATTYNLPPLKVLDYGAGLGKGTEILSEVFPEVDSFEPYPQEGFTPTFNQTDLLRWGSEALRGQLKPQYDAIVCLNVLNVLNDYDRAMTVIKILLMLNEHGMAVIGTRAWKNDIELSKTGQHDIVKKEVTWANGLIQKGFDGDELLELVKKMADGLGGGFHVERVRGIAKNCVKIVKTGEVQQNLV